jgi:hypothetical protein
LRADALPPVLAAVRRLDLRADALPPVLVVLALVAIVVAFPSITITLDNAPQDPGPTMVRAPHLAGRAPVQPVWVDYDAMRQGVT